MPIDERMVKWDDAPAQAKGKIDARLVKWEEPAKPSGPQPYDLNAGVASLMNIGQALSFGFGDELAGKLGLDRDRYRATLEQFQKDYPGSALLGTVSGSMLLPGGAGKLFAQAPKTAAAVTGAVTGSLQGAGDAPEMQDIPKSALTQGGAAAVAAPFVMGMAKPIGSVMSALGAKVSDKWAEQVARRRVATALERDSTDATKVGQNMAGMGAEARIADGAGENTRSLLDLNANLPGKTQQNLETVIRNRIATRPERLDPAVYAVNGGHGRAGEVFSALDEQKRKMATPFYNQIDQMSVPVDADLAQILGAVKELGGFRSAKKMAIAGQKDFTLAGVKEGSQVAMRDLDLAKRGLDDLIESQTDPLTGKVSSMGRAFVGLKQNLVSRLDDLSKDANGQSIYKAARDAYAGPAALQTALTRGRSVLRDDAESIASMMADMSHSEQEAFRIGASEALRQKFGNQAGQGQFLNAWKDRNVREKLQALMGDDVKYNDVIKLLKSEETLKRLESLGPGRNSRTFSREAAAEDQAMGVAGDLVSMGASAKMGSVAGMVNGAKNMYGRITTPEPVRDSIGNILLQQYSTPELNALREVQEALRRQRAAGSAAAGVAAGKTNLPGLLD